MEVKSRFFSTSPYPGHPQPIPSTSKPVLFASSALFEPHNSLHRLVTLLGADFALRKCEAEARPLFGVCDIFRAGAAPVALTIVETSTFWLPSKERDQICTRLSEFKLRHRQSFILAVDDESEDDTWRTHLDAVQQGQDRLRHAKLESCQLLRPGMKAMQLLQAASEWPPLFMYANIDELADRIVQLLARVTPGIQSRAAREESRRIGLNKSVMVATLQNALPFLRPVEVSLLIDTYGSVASICAAFDDIDAVEAELAIDRDKLVETYRVLNGAPAEYDDHPDDTVHSHHDQPSVTHQDEYHEQESEYPDQTQYVPQTSWQSAAYPQSVCSMDYDVGDDDDLESLVFSKR